MFAFKAPCSPIKNNYPADLHGEKNYNSCLKKIPVVKKIRGACNYFGGQEVYENWNYEQGQCGDKGPKVQALAGLPDSGGAQADQNAKC